MAESDRLESSLCRGLIEPGSGTVGFVERSYSEGAAEGDACAATGPCAARRTWRRLNARLPFIVAMQTQRKMDVESERKKKEDPRAGRSRDGTGRI